MSRSILKAIKERDWAFEPEVIAEDSFESTTALPGTNEKIDELAKRARNGLPLWHSADRQTFDPSEISK